MTGRAKSLVAATTALLLATAAAAFAESHVRIVRLSYITGQVKMDRASGQGLERAILNSPIIQGTRIATGNDGLAEVEFENESVLRIAENSEIQFSTLSMNEAGAKTNEVDVVKGLVYLSSRSKGDEVFRLHSGDSTFVALRDAQLRLTASPDQVQLAVFKGDVQLTGQPQAVNVKKKETLTVSPNSPADYKVVAGTKAISTDAWNQEREAYQQSYAGNYGNPGPKVGYGLQDLNYYGNFFMANGYGYVWQPYGFANTLLGWDPYSAGAWMFYPGLGYTFASSYPWGWLPYHYGSWAFLNGTGWVWVPGGAYRNGWYASGFQPTPVVVKGPPGWTAGTPPAKAVAQSTKPTVIVGRATSAAYIPGGRIPPAFANVIPGHGVAANAIGQSMNSPAVRSRSVNENAFKTKYDAFGTGHTATAGHVFVAPAPSVLAPSVGTPLAGGPGMGASSAGTAASPMASSPHAASTGHSSAGHSAGPNHH